MDELDDEERCMQIELVQEMAVEIRTAFGEAIAATGHKHADDVKWLGGTDGLVLDATVSAIVDLVRAMEKTKGGFLRACVLRKVLEDNHFYGEVS